MVEDKKVQGVGANALEAGAQPSSPGLDAERAIEKVIKENFEFVPPAPKEVKTLQNWIVLKYYLPSSQFGFIYGHKDQFKALLAKALNRPFKINFYGRHEVEIIIKR